MLTALRVFATHAAPVIPPGFNPVADFLALGVKQAQLRQQQEACSLIASALPALSGKGGVRRIDCNSSSVQLRMRNFVSSVFRRAIVSLAPRCGAGAASSKAQIQGSSGAEFNRSSCG